jgi:hypothetical protein
LSQCSSGGRAFSPSFDPVSLLFSCLFYKINKMKSLALLTLSYLACALPQGRAPTTAPKGAYGNAADEALNAPDCKDIYLIVARGSMEPGNIVRRPPYPSLRYIPSVLPGD